MQLCTVQCSGSYPWKLSNVKSGAVRTGGLKVSRSHQIHSSSPCGVCALVECGVTGTHHTSRRANGGVNDITEGADERTVPQLNHVCLSPPSSCCWRWHKHNKLSDTEPTSCDHLYIAIVWKYERSDIREIFPLVRRERSRYSVRPSLFWFERRPTKTGG